jgi:hypothetical protein
MMNLKKTIRIELEFDANQWQLYTSKPEAALVADAINKVIATAVNSGAAREETYMAAHAVMREHHRTGAYDTEPLSVLRELLDEIYGVDRF